MPRRPRAGCAGLAFHVMNRGARRTRLFETDEDYRAFAGILGKAHHRVPMRVLAYVFMPNHWHLVLWPREDRDLSAFMAWATAMHVRLWHLAHETVGTGTLYQSRFKAVPVKDDGHFLAVCRYVERNPVRAGLVARADDWTWSSASPVGRRVGPPLDDWPLERPMDWDRWLNTPETAAELERVRRERNGPPVGPPEWSRDTAARLGWRVGQRAPGRPRNPTRVAEPEIDSDPV